MSDPSQRFEARAGVWAIVMACGVSVALSAVLARVVQLELKPNPKLTETVGSHVSKVPEPAVRGDIMDRRGRLLASTRFGVRIVVNPYMITDLERKEAEKAAGKVKDKTGAESGRVFEATLDQQRAGRDEKFVKLAEAAGLDPAKIGLPISTAIEKNIQRAAVVTASGGPASLLAVSETPTPDQADVVNAADAKPKRPIQYLAVSDVLTDAQADAVKKLKLPWVFLESRPVREYPGGLSVAPIVGKVGFEEDNPNGAAPHGTIGAERMLADDLAGQAGGVKYVRDAKGNPLWIEPGDVIAAREGKDLRLSIDLEIQRIAGEELQQGVEKCNAAGGRCIVFDPKSGEVLAMVDLLRYVPQLAEFPWVKVEKDENGKVKKKGAAAPVPEREPSVAVERYRVLPEDPERDKDPALGHNRCIEHVYEPGSTFKPFVWSVITEMGKARLDEVFNTEGGMWVTPYGRLVHDVHRHPTMTWREVLVNSSNIGMGKGAERLTFAQLRSVPIRFGFGSKTEIGLPGESGGRVTPMKDWSVYTQSSVAFGQEIAVTPMQMVRAFSAFCRPGDLGGTLPRVRLVAAEDSDVAADVIYRVIKPSTSMTTRNTMEAIAENMQKSIRGADGKPVEWRYELFGKSGTAEIPLSAPAGYRAPKGVHGYYSKQYFSSFIAGGPLEEPRLVVLVVIDDPGPELTHTNRAYGALTAGPVVRMVMERALTYLGVPPSPKADDAGDKAKQKVAALSGAEKRNVGAESDRSE